MIGNKLEQSIIGVFQNDLSSTFSINKVSKILNKSYPLINRKSNFFLKEGVLSKLNIGRSYQCFLNMQNDKTRILMTLNEVRKKEEYISKISDRDVMEQVSELASRFPIDLMILYKKSIIIVHESRLDKDLLKQQSILTEKYSFVFMDKERLKVFFLENSDFRRYYLVLFNPYRFIELISQLKDKLLLSTYQTKSYPSAMMEKHNGR